MSSKPASPVASVQSMVICRFIGGYNGKHGSVTAYRNINLPCVPFDGLEIVLDGQSLYVEHSCEYGDGANIRWDADTGEWFFSVKDVGDYGNFKTCDTLKQIIKWYEDHGWDVDDYDDVRQGR